MQAKAKYAVSGALAGAVNGLFGGGGGMVLVPLLSGWCGMEGKRSFATCVAVILPLSAVSAAVYLLRQGFELAAALPYLLGGLAGAWLFCKQRRLSFDTLGRDLVPALPLFHAFGRVGCFLAGCCYGIPAPAGWLGVTFPASAIEAPSGVPLLPVQLYEAAGCVLLFLLLDHLTDRGWPGGRLLALYLALYAVFRFLLEFLRGDAVRGSLGPLSTSQVISLAVLAGVLLAELLHHRRNIRQRP